MTSTTLLFIIIITSVIVFYYSLLQEEEEDQICGTVEHHDALERSVYLKKPPFTPGQIVNVYITDVNNTGGKFKQRIVDIVNGYVAPHVNLKFVFVDSSTPSSSGALISVNNDSSKNLTET